MQRFTERVHVPMRKADVAKLDAVARRRDIPRSQVIRELVKKGLEAERPRSDDASYISAAGPE